MADAAPPGRQLLFDLLAASGETPPRSSFETAAWAVAAELAQSAQPRSTGSAGDPEPDQPDTTDRTTAPERADEPENEEAEEAKPASLHLVDPEHEPPLEPVDPPLVSVPATPGPRVSAFAAATGASIAPSPEQTRHPASGREAPADQSGPAAIRQGAAVEGDINQTVVTAESQSDSKPASSHERDLPTWIHPPLIPATATASADLAEDLRAAVAGASDGPAIAEIPPPVGADPIDVPAAAPPSGGRSSEAPSSLPRRQSTLMREDDDDFGPLVLPESQRRLRRRHRADDDNHRTAQPSRKSAGRRRTAGIGAAVLLVLATAVGVWWALPTRSNQSAPTPASEVAMVEWRGIALPVSASSGPAERTDARVAGFAPTDLGAAIAAAQLSVRTDPAAGPEVFEPVLADQVVGARDRLADAVRAQFEAGPADGAPGTLLGWRLDGDPADGGVTVHLAVQHADGTRADYAVPLAWVDGDWRLDAPESGPFFPITDLVGDYQPFVEETTP